ncbi:XrtA system polysaccharide chain length determinant [Falsiroseomonas sp. E2-1-a4]|uniref:XrtA system polysaccharide chain length determinant n=1 Tax=Falsiroseomonas sp. E2-1-a4 TaxID=3239299 RepID=UPI003F394E25
MDLHGLLRRALAAGARHRWRALALAWVVCLGGWAGVTMLPNQYVATTRVYADADAILGLLLRGIAIDSSPASQVETLQRTLLSRPNLEKIITRTQLREQIQDPVDQEQMLTRLARDIRLQTQTRNLFTIEFQDRNPQLAHDVVATTLNLFMEAAMVTDRQQMDNARNFVAEQTASYEVQLRQAENRRAEFRARYLDILPSDALGGASRLEAARTRLAQVQGELIDTRRRRDLTQQQLQEMAAVPAPAVTTGGGNPRLVEAQRQLAELRLRFTDSHPDVRAALAVVNAARAGGGGGGGARAAVAQPQNQALEMLRLRLVDVESEIASLERQEREGIAELERLDEIARSAPQVQAQFLNLDRDYTVLRRNYDELLARRESLQLAGAARDSSDRVQLEVVDPPTVPAQPVSPNRFLLSAGVLVVGLGAGVGLVLLLMQLDRSFYTLADLRRIGLPVLGAVSAPPRRGAMISGIGFAGGLAMLFVAFGAVLADAPRIIARMLLA